MKRRIHKWMKIIFISAFALLFAQGPEFMQQYMNHLSGHYEELKIQDSLLKKLAGEEDLRTFVIKLKEIDHPIVVKQGEFVEQLIDRKEQFEKALNVLKSAEVWNFPFYFLRYFDFHVGQETLNHFNLGLSITWNGLLFALLGVVLGTLLWTGFHALFKKRTPVQLIDNGS